MRRPTTGLNYSRECGTRTQWIRRQSGKSDNTRGSRSLGRGRTSFAELEAWRRKSVQSFPVYSTPFGHAFHEPPDSHPTNIPPPDKPARVAICHF